MLYRDFPAPTLPIGANVLVSDIGAYTTVSATRFNGFEPAAVLVWEDQADLVAKRRKLREADEASSASIAQMP